MKNSNFVIRQGQLNRYAHPRREVIVPQNDKIQLFEDKRIRTVWNEEKEDWYFSIVDVIAVLTEQPDQRAASNYWAKLKQRLKEEGADQLLTNCQQLKLKSPKDGKRYKTDVADTERLLRIIQSIPSPKAEPFKRWLAEVGRERIEETIDPELTIDRALETYLKKGYTREWINQRLQAIQVRKELTDEWDARGVQKGVEYAILTDEISRAWSGMSTRQYKNLKGLKKENLRDNMTTLELVLNMLAEATTTQFSKDRKPTTFQENLEVAKAGGQVAGRTRKDIESQSNTPVISPKNAAQLNQVVTDLLEGAAADMSEMPEKK
jgi:prophage antirepressor-like protein